MAKKTVQVTEPSSANAPVITPIPAATKEPPKYVTHEEIEGLIRSINAKFGAVDSKAADTSFRLETLIKATCQNGKVDYSSYVVGLRQFHVFSLKVEELKNVPKLSERIKAALTYNESIKSTDEFQILADDIDILKDAANSESISKENFDSCLKLPCTALFRELLSKYLPNS